MLPALSAPPEKTTLAEPNARWRTTRGPGSAFKRGPLTGFAGLAVARRAQPGSGDGWLAGAGRLRGRLKPGTRERGSLPGLLRTAYGARIRAPSPRGVMTLAESRTDSCTELPGRHGQNIAGELWAYRNKARRVAAWRARVPVEGRRATETVMWPPATTRTAPPMAARPLPASGRFRRPSALPRPPLRKLFFSRREIGQVLLVAEVADPLADVSEHVVAATGT